MNVKKSLRKFGRMAACFLCLVSLTGCSTGWEDVTIVDEGNGGTMSVGLDTGTNVFERIYEPSIAKITERASGMNKYLVEPSIKKIGANTIQIESVETKVGTATSVDDL